MYSFYCSKIWKDYSKILILLRTCLFYFVFNVTRGCFHAQKQYPKNNKKPFPIFLLCILGSKILATIKRKEFLKLLRILHSWIAEWKYMVKWKDKVCRVMVGVDSLAYFLNEECQQLTKGLWSQWLTEDLQSRVHLSRNRKLKLDDYERISWGFFQF